MEWDTYAICPGCGDNFRAPFGSAFHVHFSACPKCGERKRDSWTVKVMRWVSTSRLFSPSTWGTGHWETK